MAKKTNTTKKNTEKKLSIKAFFCSERTRFVTGLIISFITIYFAIAMVSFFFTGAADQSKVENVPVGELLASHEQVGNWTGVRGAFIADTLINNWFGLSSFMIIIFLGAVGIKLMNIKRIKLLNTFLFCAATLIWSSVFFAFVFINSYQDSFIYLGGKHGYYISEILIRNLGIPGTILALAVSFLIIAVFCSKSTIPALQHAFSFDWAKRKAKEPDDEVVEDSMDDNAVATPIKEEEEEEIVQEPVNEDEEDNSQFVVTVAPEDELVPEENLPTQEVNSNDNSSHYTFTVNHNENDDENYDASSLGEYDPKLDLSSFRNPTIDLLQKYDSNEHPVDMDEQINNQKRIKQTLESFGISISSIKATVGPTITLYEVVPDAGVRISKIKNLEDDIALNLAAIGIRIIAPMPGKGTIGIEVPNKDPQIVSMQTVISSRKFQETKYDLPVALGKTIMNEVFMFDLCKMPHLLVAGATGQGKSVGLNAIITSLLYKKHPSELKFVLVDPKMVEFSMYSNLEKFYLAKLPGNEEAVITDFTKVIETLNSICTEMENRYKLFQQAQLRNIKEYNQKFISRHLNPEKGHKFLPFIVVVIDEYGDLMMQAGREIETPIARIAQKGRAAGIHMIIATQRPSTNIITGIIKANFTSRMAFRVQQMVDSRTILDAPGANQLVGRGDMLFSQGGETTRVQCAFIDTPEVQQIVKFISNQTGYPTAFMLPEYVPDEDANKMPGTVDLSERDPLFEDAARLIVIQQQGSTSLIQRKFAIGYNRAGRIMDQLEQAGIVGPFEGSKARQVLIQDAYGLEQLLNSLK